MCVCHKCWEGEKCRIDEIKERERYKRKREERKVGDRRAGMCEETQTKVNWK